MMPTNTDPVVAAYLLAREELKRSINSFLVTRFCLAELYAREHHPGMQLPPLVRYLFGDEMAASELLFPEPESPAAQEMDQGFQVYLHDLHKKHEEQGL